MDNFLQAFRRFVGRRSLPQLLISDNGSTFLAVAEELKTLFTSTELSEALAHKGTQRKFIPKRAPWFGGFWERLVGLTKNTLKKILGRTHITLEGLQTIIVEVEALLNERPLTYTSCDISDPEPISPSQLLQGRRIVTLPYPMTQDDDPEFGNNDDSALRHRAKRQVLLIDHFWKRWRNEYLTPLRETHRTTGNNDQQVKVGDVVLVHDDTKRVNWKLAVIESVNKGRDNIIRSANIRTSTGRTNHPISRLYPLEVSSSTDLTTRQPSIETSERSESPVPPKRPVREAAKRGQIQMKEWITSLCGPRRMSWAVIDL